jgi:hypothetical protein
MNLFGVIFIDINASAILTVSEGFRHGLSLIPVDVTHDPFFTDPNAESFYPGGLNTFDLRVQACATSRGG